MKYGIHANVRRQILLGQIYRLGLRGSIAPYSYCSAFGGQELQIDAWLLQSCPFELGLPRHIAVSNVSTADDDMHIVTEGLTIRPRRMSALAHNPRVACVVSDPIQPSSCWKSRI